MPARRRRRGGCSPSPIRTACRTGAGSRRGVAAVAPGTLVGGMVEVLSAGPVKSPTEAFEAVFAFDNATYVRAKGFTVTANLFVIAADFARVGPFPVGVSEDIEWCWRARDAGLRLVFCRGRGRRPPGAARHARTDGKVAATEPRAVPARTRPRPVGRPDPRPGVADAAGRAGRTRPCRADADPRGARAGAARRRCSCVSAGSVSSRRTASRWRGGARADRQATARSTSRSTAR